MQRVTVSLDEDTASSFDNLLLQQGYQSRSEAVRDLVRQAVETRRLESEAGAHCVANLSYVFNYRTRILAQRLLALQHEHHELVVATTRVILDHQSSLETIILRGPTSAVRALTDAIRIERGVKFGAINLISVEPNDRHDRPAEHHHHHDLGHASPHTH